MEQEASSSGMKETDAIPVPQGPTASREFLETWSGHGVVPAP